MAYPTVTVFDLTASLGLHALTQLGVPHTSGPGLWPQIALGSGSTPLRLDWHRPDKDLDLSTTATDAAATILLVGPGSINRLRSLLDALAASAAPSKLWAFLMPNALMEDAVIKALPPSQAQHIQIFRLPDSSPQTLWFILMEQLGKLDFKHFLALQPSPTPRDDMSSNLKQCMIDTMTIDGALAAALVDYRSGMCLAQAGGGMNLELAAAGNSQVVKAKLATMESLGLRRGIEDILITLGDQYHLIRLVPNNAGLFLYLVLDKSKGNLALARYKLTDIERSLKV
jgi:hypothetical protein